MRGLSGLYFLLRFVSLAYYNLFPFIQELVCLWICRSLGFMIYILDNRIPKAIPEEIHDYCGHSAPNKSCSNEPRSNTVPFCDLNVHGLRVSSFAYTCIHHRLCFSGNSQNLENIASPTYWKVQVQ